MDTTTDLQSACFSTLADDPALRALTGPDRVFDRVPERVRPPYVVLGRSTVSDWNTASDDGDAIVFFVHTWSRRHDRQENHAIQDAIRNALEDGVTLADNHLVALRFQLAETRRDRPSGYVHGVLRFRAVVERPST